MLLALIGVALVAVSRFLLIGLLLAVTPQDQRHPIFFPVHLGSLDHPPVAYLNAAQFFAAFGDHDFITDLKCIMPVEPGQAQGRVLRISNFGRRWRFGQGAVAGATLNVLHSLLVRPKVAIAHDLLLGVAIDTIQLPFAQGKLADRLVILAQPAALSRHGIRHRIARWRQVWTRGKGHRAEGVVAPVVAVVALAIGNSRGELVAGRVPRLITGKCGVGARVMTLFVV
jgi:hypothetical protein